MLYQRRVLRHVGRRTPPPPPPPPAPTTTAAAATATAAAAAEVKVQSLIAHYVRISYVFYTSIMYIIRPCHAGTTLATTVPMLLLPRMRRYCRRYGIKDGSRHIEGQNTCALQKVKTSSAFTDHQCQLRPSRPASSITSYTRSQYLRTTSVSSLSFKGSDRQHHLFS